MKRFTREELYGIVPTDESAIKAGEIEVITDDYTMTVRIAGGLRLDEVTFSLEEFSELLPAEILPDGQDDSFRSRCVGFRHTSGVQFIFIQQPTWGEPDLLIRNWMADYLGETMLLSRARILNCAVLWLHLRWLDWQTKGGVPFLSRGGKTARHASIPE